jgi:hypothetical protein
MRIEPFIAWLRHPGMTDSFKERALPLPYVWITGISHRREGI